MDEKARKPHTLTLVQEGPPGPNLPGSSSSSYAMPAGSAAQPDTPSIGPDDLILNAREGGINPATGKPMTKVDVQLTEEAKERLARHGVLDRIMAKLRKIEELAQADPTMLQRLMN